MGTVLLVRKPMRAKRTVPVAQNKNDLDTRKDDIFA